MILNPFRKLPTSGCYARISAEGEVTVPESLTRAQSELRATAQTLAAIQKRIEGTQVQIEAIPKRIREAERIYISQRANVAEIELQEALPAFIDVIARAAVATAIARGGDRDRSRSQFLRSSRPASKSRSTQSSRHRATRAACCKSRHMRLRPRRALHEHAGLRSCHVV